MSSAGGYMQILGMVANRAGSEVQRREANLESKAFKKQGNLAAEEAETSAGRTEQEGERFQARQKLAFLKSGVSLQGSPLLALAETEKEFKTQAEATRRAGGARRTFFRRQAGQARSRGRAAAIQTTTENLGTLTQLSGGLGGG